MFWLIIQSLLCIAFASVALYSDIALASALYGFSSGIWFSMALNTFFRLPTSLTNYSNQQS
jgi:hypothetical protein